VADRGDALARVEQIADRDLVAVAHVGLQLLEELRNGLDAAHMHPRASDAGLS
jgi:hypothetical protein